MKNYRIWMAALTMLAAASSAQSSALASSEKIIVNCRAGWTPYMADVASAVERSRYFATPNARREMLTLARQACASGSTKVAFVPPQDQR